MCISRTTSSVQVKVVGSSETLLGVTDIFTCLQSILESSPEIMSNLDKCDFAVYSTDYSEIGLPAVGHGLFTWILLSASSSTPKPSQTMKDILKARDNNVSLLGIPDERLTVGKVCSDALSLFSSSGTESLEIKITLSPVGSFTQKEYLESLNIYKSLSQFLPSNFDHPAWSRFVSDNNLLEKFMVASREKQSSSPSKKRSKKLDIGLSEKSILEALPTGSKRQLSQSASEFNKSDEDKIINAKRQRSDLFQNTEGDIEVSGFTSFQFQSFTGSPSTNAFCDSDLLDNFSSVINNTLPVDSCQFPLSVPDLTNMNWYDNESSPVTASPNFPGMPQKQPAKFTNSISDPNIAPAYSADFSNVDRVVAQGGRKLKNKEKIQKSYPLYCENCGQLESSAWRKSKVIINGLEQIFRLCNPCGLWLQKKKTLRPRERWEKDRKITNDHDSSKEKKQRKLDTQTSGKLKSNSPLDIDKSAELTKNKSPEPTIAEQLALNVSKGRQNKSELSVRTHAMLYRSPESASQDGMTPSASLNNIDNIGSSTPQTISDTKESSKINDGVANKKPNPDQQATLSNKPTPKDSAKTPNSVNNYTSQPKSSGRLKKQKEYHQSSTPRLLVPLIPNIDNSKNTISPIYNTKLKQNKAKKLLSVNRYPVKVNQGRKKSATGNFSELPVSSPNKPTSEFLSPKPPTEKEGENITSLLSTSKTAHENEISDLLFYEFLSDNIYSSNSAVQSSNNTPSELVDPSVAYLGDAKPGTFDELASELGIYDNIDTSRDENFIDSVWSPHHDKPNPTGDVINMDTDEKETPHAASVEQPVTNDFDSFNEPGEETKTDKLTLPSSPPSHYPNTEDNWSDDETPLDES